MVNLFGWPALTDRANPTLISDQRFHLVNIDPILRQKVIAPRSMIQQIDGGSTGTLTAHLAPLHLPAVPPVVVREHLTRQPLATDNAQEHGRLTTLHRAEASISGFEIRDGARDSLRIVGKLAKPAIAGETQNSADPSGLVIVIDVSSWRMKADRA